MRKLEFRFNELKGGRKLNERKSSIFHPCPTHPKYKRVPFYVPSILKTRATQWKQKKADRHLVQIKLRAIIFIEWTYISSMISG